MQSILVCVCVCAYIFIHINVYDICLMINTIILKQIQLFDIIKTAIIKRNLVFFISYLCLKKRKGRYFKYHWNNGKCGQEEYGYYVIIHICKKKGRKMKTIEILRQFFVDKKTAIKWINSLYTVTEFYKLNAFNKFLRIFVVVCNLNKIFIIMIRWTQFKCLVFNVCVVLQAIKLIFICKRNNLKKCLK